MEVFEKVLFNALMDVMDKVWNEQVDADNSVETNSIVVENELI
jgi:hypothetical protein